MSKPAFASIDQQVKSDFGEIWKSYDHQRLEEPGRQRELFRSAHKYAVSLSLMAKAINNREQHQRIFLQELSSDAIHLMHVLMAGDRRGGCFYLRSIIENFWRHHYFRDHPIEYGWLHTRPKFHLTMKDLREHCSWLDVFGGKLNVSLVNLDRMYSELSMQVHSTSSKTLVLRETMDQIVLSQSESSNVAKSVRAVLKDVIVLTIFASRDVFDGLHVNSQSFILGCLDATTKHRRQMDL